MSELSTLVSSLEDGDNDSPHVMHARQVRKTVPALCVHSIPTPEVNDAEVWERERSSESRKRRKPERWRVSESH